jgi:hypothetical protein
VLGPTLRTVFIASLLSACTHHVADLSLVSTKQVPVRPYVLARGVIEEECTHQVLFVPLGAPHPDLGRLVDRLLTQVQQGNVLTEVTAEESSIFTFFWNRRCLRVRGTVAQFH